MRIRSITLLLALGTAGTVACGGGGTLDSNGNPPLKNGTYQAPPATYDAPSLPNPTDYDQPETDYQAPPDQSEAGGTASGGSVAAVCTRFCHEVLALNCTGAPSGPAAEAECADGCSEIEFEIPCPGPFATALNCLFDNLTLTCDLFVDDGAADPALEETLVNACRGPLEDYARCAGSDPGENPDPDPEPPGDCEPNSCRNCLTDCDECLCDTGNDVEYCTDRCINQ